MHLSARWWLGVFPREQNTKADNGPEIAAAADTVSLIVREPPLIGRVQHYIGLVRHSLTLFSITTDNGVKKQPPQARGFEIQTTRSGDVFDSSEPLACSI